MEEKGQLASKKRRRTSRTTVRTVDGGKGKEKGIEIVGRADASYGPGARPNKTKHRRRADISRSVVNRFS